MLSIVSCAYWPSVRKWPLCVSRGKKRLYSHPWDGVPRTGKRSGVCSSAGSGCLNSIWLGDCAPLMGHSGLGPARFHCNEASNSRQMEGTMALRGFWGVEEGWQPYAAVGWPTPGGAFGCPRAQTLSNWWGTGDGWHKWKRLGPLPIWLLSHCKFNSKKVDVMELDPWGLWNGFWRTALYWLFFRLWRCLR